MGLEGEVPPSGTWGQTHFSDLGALGDEVRAENEALEDEALKLRTRIAHNEKCLA